MRPTEDELERKWRSKKIDSSDTKAIGSVMVRNAVFFNVTVVLTSLLCMASGKINEPWGVIAFLIIALLGGIMSFSFALRWYKTYVLYYLPALNKKNKT